LCFVVHFCSFLLRFLFPHPSPSLGWFACFLALLHLTSKCCQKSKGEWLRDGQPRIS
jgi:hypothetical protein